MPTARELLEQADALMRRNRASVEDDIPVLTDAIPPMEEGQSHFAAKLLQVPDANRIPVDDGGVPVLTDAVEEIEAAAPVAAVDEGEPSDWLDFEAGEPSVIGDAPDSIAIVPPLDLRRAEQPTDIDEFDGLDEELAAAVAAAPREEETLQPASPPKALQPPGEAVADTPMIAPAIFSGGAAALLQDAAIPPSLVAAPSVPFAFLPTPSAPAGMPDAPTGAPAVAPDVPATASFDAPAAASSDARFDAAPAASADALFDAPEAAPPDALFDAPAAGPFDALLDAPAAAPSDAPLDAPAAAPTEPIDAPVDAPAVAMIGASAMAPAVVDDSAHWEAMAEEIRMQVLQRIDLFTDTGLRAQLGERLQPIVDRASADLVATINSHVGEILRAYVAEAIEREIESWRKNH